MLDRKSECLTVNCLQIFQFLNTEIFVRSIFFGSPSTLCDSALRVVMLHGVILLRCKISIKTGRKNCSEKSLIVERQV